MLCKYSQKIIRGKNNNVFLYFSFVLTFWGKKPEQIANEPEGEKTISLSNLDYFLIISFYRRIYLIRKLKRLHSIDIYFTLFWVKENSYFLLRKVILDIYYIIDS